jgi:protease IV
MAEQENVKDNSWQQQTIEKLALSGLKEQQTARRWSTFFKGLTYWG